MNHSSPPMEAQDYPLSSSMSENDSLSDSDWLDISSNRESDDNDSVVSGASDREDVGIPISRRSSISIGSSRDGDVEAWEGFVDDSSDEESQGPEVATTAVPSLAVDQSIMGASELTVNGEHDPVEDQRVKEALDQSLISTLSASRSSTASAHTSIRDLRLSFPDPLTSSKDELNRSYEDVSPSETTFSSAGVPTDEAADVYNYTADLTDAPRSKEDPGSLSTTPAVPEPVVPVRLEEDKARFEVVLYGASTPIKWSFVQELVQKAFLSSTLTLTDITPSTLGPTRYLKLQQKVEGSSNIAHLIPIHDRTENFKPSDLSISQTFSKRPSLAVLYLPCAIHALPEHSLYLPVLAPSRSETSGEWSRVTAANDWATLSIPAHKVARLGFDAGSPIFDGKDIGEVQDMRAHRLFHRLLFEGKKRAVKSLSEHLSPVHAVTLFALMSLIVGFTMNTAFRRSSIPAPTPTATTTTTPPASTFWGMFGPDVNQTSISVFVSTAKVNTRTAATVQKELSLSIFNPGATSLSLTSKAAVTSASATSKAKDAQCEPSTSWTAKDESMTDIIVRPSTQLSVDSKPSNTMAPSTSTWVAESAALSKSPSTALAVVVQSLTEVLDMRMSRLRHDLEELDRAIRQQTEVSKGKAKEIRDQLHSRNDRARGNAKELKKKGEEIIYAAGKELMGRTEVAKQKARELSLSVVNSEPWRAYTKVHSEWVARLKDKGSSKRGSVRRRKGKGQGKGKCRQRGQTTTQTSFFSWSYAEVLLA
ncbi:hypothetical protein H0H81_010190 [Sphagnurus paluster]|uniref:Uncharacterized protein n=1 Tax=Sphagnurus paluster TaxID=117069 RepID=A0A9P7FUW1_9AGAR|nr:hypothetical protein H0H81_010190 [Sphagnurus paluster]